MFQIKYNNVFLSLAPNQECEIERNSPLFLIETYFAESSTPITIAYSDETAKAIGYYFFEPSVRKRVKLAVEVYDHDTYKCNATLVLESAGMNSVHKAAGTAGGYLLIGISDFLQTIQTKKLTDLKLGGDRVFNFTSWDRADGSNGWYQHFHDTWNFNPLTGLPDYDYVFTPCRNDNWTGDPNDISYNGYMNALNVTDHVYAVFAINQPMVPFVYIKYILECIFKENGWSVDFSGINDTEWQKLVLWSVKPLHTTQDTYNWATDGSNQVETIHTPIGKMTIRLSDFMPADYTCAQFITAICIRYGFAPIPSINTRSCRFVALKEVINKPSKDWTKYAGAESGSQVTVDEKIIAFKNVFEGSDNLASPPDFTGYTILNPVDSFSDLPDPVSGSYDNALIFVYEENQYFNVVLNETNTLRLWDVFTDNIYDDGPPEGVDATQSFETKCVTLPVYKSLLRSVGNTDYYAWFPACAQSQYEKFGIKTLLYHGQAYELGSNGFIGTMLYPYAGNSHLRHDINVAPDLTWSNTFRQKNAAGADFGLITYWYQVWLDATRNVEDAFKKRYYLPLHELLKYNWDDIILDRNNAYIIKQIIEPLPYKGFIECTMQRLSLDKPVTVATIAANKIYLKLAYSNYVYDKSFEYYGPFLSDWDNATTADIIVSAYSDAAGTQPVDLSGFVFQTVTNTVQTYNDGSVKNFTETKSWILNGTSIEVNYNPYNIIEGDYSMHYVGYNGKYDGHKKYTMSLVINSAYEIIS